jgi:sulfur relay (sulfurtransferase) DsrC/TusE family protein
MKFLVTQIQKKRGAYNDYDISPKIRQVLQHWGYKLTKGDFNREMKIRRKK